MKEESNFLTIIKGIIVLVTIIAVPVFISLGLYGLAISGFVGAVAMVVMLTIYDRIISLLESINSKLDKK